MSDVDTQPVPGDATETVAPVATPAATTTDSAPVPTETPNGAAPANPKDPPQGEEPEWFKQRIKQVTRQRRESERRADRLAAEIEALKKAPSQPQARSTELRAEDFPNYDAFIEAKIAAGVKEGIGATQKTLSEREVQQTVQRHYDTFLEKAAEQAEAADIDLDDVMETLQGAPLLSRTVVEFLAESKEPARLAEFLAENPGELDRVSRLGPALAKKSLAKVEAGFAAKPQSNATKAPPPIKPVGGRAVHQGDPLKTDDMEEYHAHWQARRAKLTG